MTSASSAADRAPCQAFPPLAGEDLAVSVGGLVVGEAEVAQGGQDGQEGRGEDGSAGQAGYPRLFALGFLA